MQGPFSIALENVKLMQESFQNVSAWEQQERIKTNKNMKTSWRDWKPKEAKWARNEVVQRSSCTTCLPSLRGRYTSKQRMNYQ